MKSSYRFAVLLYVSVTAITHGQVSQTSLHTARTQEPWQRKPLIANGAAVQPRAKALPLPSSSGNTGAGLSADQRSIMIKPSTIKIIASLGTPTPTPGPTPTPTPTPCAGQLCTPVSGGACPCGTPTPTPTPTPCPPMGECEEPPPGPGAFNCNTPVSADCSDCRACISIACERVNHIPCIAPTATPTGTPRPPPVCRHADYFSCCISRSGDPEYGCECVDDALEIWVEPDYRCIMHNGSPWCQPQGIATIVLVPWCLGMT